MPAAARTFTRTAIAGILDDAGRGDLLGGVHSRLLDYFESTVPGVTALAFVYDQLHEATAFLAIMSVVLGDDAVDFASQTTEGQPTAPGIQGQAEWYWPHWVLDEPCWEQWVDEINVCLACESDPDGRCAIHEHPPWCQAPVADTQPGIATRPQLSLVHSGK